MNRNSKGPPVVRPAIASLLGLVIGVGGWTLTGCQPAKPPAEANSIESEATFSEQLQAVTDAGLASAMGGGVSEASLAPPEIQAFCSDCHALPNPESFERDVWYEEIRKGYEFYARSGRSDLSPPAPELVHDFYREHAPVRLEFPELPGVDAQWKARFVTTKLDWKEANYINPAISSISWMELIGEGQKHLVVTDMRDGSISLVTPSVQASTRRVLGRVANPARVTLVDFNADGLQDLVVSDLGSLMPFDHDFGKVVLLKRQPDSEEFEAENLVEGLGRVADCAVHDFRGDEQLDLVVAEFGHRRGGSIRCYTNRSADSEVADAPEVSFEEQVLDIRPGTIRIPTHDWDRDGKMDLAAVISQEYEALDLLLNRETKFDSRNVFLGNDLAYGSIGIELVDLDQDGDQDILQVNGDCFDNNYANRSHGIAWHENLGELKFQMHRLIDLPGAYRALPGDIDGDGDLDIVAVANLPATVKPLLLRESNPVSILVLERRTGEGSSGEMVFEPHVLERGIARYPALEVADFNGDQRLDFAVGAQLLDGDPLAPSNGMVKVPRVTIWWQR